MGANEFQSLHTDGRCRWALGVGRGGGHLPEETAGRPGPLVACLVKMILADTVALTVAPLKCVQPFRCLCGGTALGFLKPSVSDLNTLFSVRLRSSTATSPTGQ